MLLDALVEGLPEAVYGLLRGERAAEELARGGLLHDLRPRVACEATEAVRTVDDVTLSSSAVGHQERPI